jgi:hypothetical protein
MSLNTLHADQQNHSRSIGQSINSAANQNLLTNTTVAAADTNQGLQDAVTAAGRLAHADYQNAAPRINRALAAGNSDSTLVDANILALITTAGLLALTQAGTDPTSSQFS